MSFSETLFEFLKKSSHRFPKELFILANEGFEVVRGYITSISIVSRSIRKTQRNLLSKRFLSDTKSLIIFLTPGIDMVNGGILSVQSLFEETKRLKNEHHSEVILCTYPSDPSLLKYTKFKNNNILFDFSETLKFFSNIDSLIIHVPEHFVYRFLWFLSKNNKRVLSNINNVQINIMIQNIDYLPSAKRILKLRKIGKLTATTAHSKYSTIEIRNQLSFPLHKLSVYVSPEQYSFREYQEKDNLMIVSPDRHPMKNEILNKIKTKHPSLKIQIVQNMTYEKYKDIISKSKWALTFGEGLDAYFVEPIFSGSISFSVFNPRFFTTDFKKLPTVYENYNVLATKICDDIVLLDSELTYTAYNKELFDLCHKYYNYNEYVGNLLSFYRADYTFK